MVNLGDIFPPALWCGMAAHWYTCIGPTWCWYVCGAGARVSRTRESRDLLRTARVESDPLAQQQQCAVRCLATVRSDRATRIAVPIAADATACIARALAVRFAPHVQQANVTCTCTMKLT